MKNNIVPDEAVHAAVKGYNSSLGLVFKDMMKDALTAALPFLTGKPSPRAQALEEAHSDLLDHLNADIAQLERMVEQAKFAGSETGVRVKSPSVLLADLRDATAAIRALSSQTLADGWLPIETAPKDGSFIDLWHVNNTRVPKCRWFTNSSGYTAWHVQQGGRACNMGGDQMFTHWRPLPASPGASE